MRKRKDEGSKEQPKEEQTAGVVADTLARFLETADARRVCGDPIEKGDVTLVPLAEILTGLGFGYGTGGSSRQGDETAEEGGGGGGGGGGRVLTRSVAVVVASPEGVRVEPVVDVTKIALAGLTAAGFIAATWLGLRRKRRAVERAVKEAVE